MASRFRTVLSLGAAVAVALTAAPARADDEEGFQGTLNSVLGFIGAAPEKDKAPIEYRERPSLVIPPSRGAATLPAPQAPGGKRNAQWPNDPDVAARRAAAADARRPVNHNNAYTASGALTQEELRRGKINQGPQDTRSNCNAMSNNPDCLYTPWSVLSVKKEGSDASDTILAGQEPTRRYLTDPPSGYRQATRTTKATPSGKAAKPEDDAADAGAYIRSQRNKRFGDGED